MSEDEPWPLLLPAPREPQYGPSPLATRFRQFIEAIFAERRLNDLNNPPAWLDGVPVRLTPICLQRPWRDWDVIHLPPKST